MTHRSFYYNGHSITLFNFVLRYENWEQFLGVFSLHFPFFCADMVFPLMIWIWSSFLTEWTVTFRIRRCRIASPFEGFVVRHPNGLFLPHSWNDLEKVQKDFAFEKKRILIYNFNLNIWMLSLKRNGNLSFYFCLLWLENKNKGSIKNNNFSS